MVLTGAWWTRCPKCLIKQVSI